MTDQHGLPGALPVREPLDGAGARVHYLDEGSGPPILVFPREILASRPFLDELQRALPAVTDRPALLVWPTKDPVFGDRERKRREELFPKHSTVLLEGANHYIQEDSSEEIVTAIRDWSPG